MEVIHFYHINDLHSQFEKWPRIHRFIKERKEVQENVFVFDMGDHIDRVHPYTEATFGKSNIELLNQLEIDYATIGNNEGITLPFEALDELYNQAKFKVLLGNLYYENKQRPGWLMPFDIITTKQGTKIGLIGLTVYFAKFYQELGWSLTDPLEELLKLIAEIKNEVDILVLLSHLGIHEDEEIARRFPELDVIMGGHTHHILENGKVENQTLLTCAGKHGHYVGHIELIWNGTKLDSKTATLIDSEELPQTKTDREWVKSWREKGENLLQETIVSLPYTLTSNWEQETELSKLLVKGLRERYEAEVAILNCGLFLKDLQEGPVTKLDIHELLPHPINPCTIWLSGQELIEVVKQASEEKWMDWILKGLGFRGKVMGSFIFDGVSVIKKGGHKEVRINGEEVNPKREYKIATIDMFTFGHFFPEVHRAEKKDYDMSHMLRDIMEWKLLKTFS